MASSVPRVPRRDVVVGLALGATIGLSGCASSVIGEDGEVNPRLEAVYLSNHHTDPHVLAVLIEKDAEIIYWNDHRVDAYDPEANVAGGYTIEPPAFTSESADWRVSARLEDDEEFVRLRLAEDAIPRGCYSMTIRVTEDEQLMVLSSSPNCDEGQTESGR